MTDNAKQYTNRVLVVAGHAIYHNGRWWGGFDGEDPFYGSHIEAGVRLLKSQGWDCLVCSGGRTRPGLEKETGGLSEAEGMNLYATEKKLILPNDDTIILERWARDSFENLFFSILASFSRTGKWPQRVGIVSWNSKGLRFHLIACGLQLGGRIFFQGVGDYPAQLDLERACAAEVRFNAALVDISYLPPSYKLVDPLLRNEAEFARKRWARMPKEFTPNPVGNAKYMEQVKDAYAGSDLRIRTLIEQVDRLTPGDAWRHIKWPWL